MLCIEQLRICLDGSCFRLKTVRHFTLQDFKNIYCKGKEIHMVLIYLNVLKLDIGQASYICIFS